MNFIISNLRTASVHNVSPYQVMTMFAGVKNATVLSLDDGLQLIKHFGRLCWQFENEAQQEECFALLKETLNRFSLKARRALVMQLMEESINYPRFVFFAEEMLSSIPASECIGLKLYPLMWTFSDDFTLISANEYAWRAKRRLPCWKNKHLLCRPMSLLDLLCFDTSLKMLLKTKSPSYIYTG